MIITDSFVLLNNPKTGSSFCRAVVKGIHVDRLKARPFARRVTDRLGLTRRPFLKEVMVRQIDRPDAKPNQHGGFCQIPPAYRDREVVSVVRHPLVQLASHYEYRWWATRPELPPEVLAEHFPQFPDLSFEEYLRYLDLAVALGPRPALAAAGRMTVQFVRMFFRDPLAVHARLTDEYVDSDEPLRDVADVTFLRQESLGDDLAAFLLRKGYTAAEAEQAKTEPRVNVTERVSAGEQGPGGDRASLWTPELVQQVWHRERLMLRVLAARGIHYAPTEL